MADDLETKFAPKKRVIEPWIENLLRPALAIFALVLLGVALYFGAKENPAGLAAAATAAMGCLVFVFFPYLSEVNVLGFKAKLLDQKLTEADRVLSKLKRLAAVSMRSAYQVLTYGKRNRVAGISTVIGTTVEECRRRRCGDPTPALSGG